MNKKLGLTATLIISMLLIGCASTDKIENKQKEKQPPSISQEESMQFIKGTLFYREKIALLPDAEIKLTLEDISRADAPAIIVAEQTFTGDGDQVPLDFALSYDAREIKDQHRYSVRAQIRLDGKLIFTTDTVYPVITDRKATDSVQLTLIALK